mmetsp:Transcript_18179/g.63880  ORF Transcript_18179/g.63880 Transcript_18179/m.63880 type:complete len:224 (-) Transcript_18179:343-1014(-)
MSRCSCSVFARLRSKARYCASWVCRSVSSQGTRITPTKPRTTAATGPGTKKPPIEKTAPAHMKASFGYKDTKPKPGRSTCTAGFRIGASGSSATSAALKFVSRLRRSGRRVSGMNFVSIPVACTTSMPKVPVGGPGSVVCDSSRMASSNLLPALTKKQCACNVVSLRRTPAKRGAESGNEMVLLGLKGSPNFSPVAFQRGSSLSSSRPASVHHRSFFFAVRNT